MTGQLMRQRFTKAFELSFSDILFINLWAGFIAYAIFHALAG